MHARLRDTELYFDIDGAGLVPDGPRMREKPAVFIIHGGPGGDHSALKAACAPLADRLQLVYFDHRGQGRSARGDRQKYTLDENVEDMEALRRHLGFGKIGVVGTSYGGMVAMAHAARYPDAISHLILVVTAAHSGFIDRAKQLVAERGTPEQIAVTEDLFAGRLDTVEKLRRYYDLMGPLYAHRYDPLKARDTQDCGILSPDALNEAFAPGGFLRNFDLRPQLGSITAPTLILAGRHDWICAPEFSAEIHRHIAGSELRIFEDSSHSIRTDEPQKFIDAVAGFIV